MSTPAISIVIPTRDRPALLAEAIESVLAQTIREVEAVVVDDGSRQRVRVPRDPRIRLVRQARNRGIAAGLNAGARAARGRYLGHLDDDDLLVPRMAELSIDAIECSTLPPPVVVVSAMAVIDGSGAVLGRRIPPTRPRGMHFSLEPIEPGLAYETRNTMVADRELILALGGWDERMRSSVRNDLFLRLNPVCSILGLEEVTYLLREHSGTRVSRGHAAKHESFMHMVAKHTRLYEEHPRRYAAYLVGDARRLALMGRHGPAVRQLGRAARVHPGAALSSAGRLQTRALKYALARDGWVRAAVARRAGRRV